MPAPLRCPCLSGESYADCCEPLHDRTASAPTAVRLMRARFSAFSLGDVDYLLDSWHPKTRPTSLSLDPEQRWFRLDVVGRSGGPFDRFGTVEFRAYFRSNGVVGSQHEVSRFIRERGRWYYLDPRE